MRTVIEDGSKNMVVIDVMTKMLESRVLFINDAIDDVLANDIICQLLLLDSQNSKDPITLYINSPGGYVDQGLAIYDVAKRIKSPIHTVCVGVAASMAAVLMLLGEERKAYKHSKIMFHQPSGGGYGRYSSMEVSMEQFKLAKEELYEIVKECTTIENIEETFKEDYWLTSKQALTCNVLTEILD